MMYVNPTNESSELSAGNSHWLHKHRREMDVIHQFPTWIAFVASPKITIEVITDESCFRLN